MLREHSSVKSACFLPLSADVSISSNPPTHQFFCSLISKAKILRKKVLHEKRLEKKINIVLNFFFCSRKANFFSYDIFFPFFSLSSPFGHPHPPTMSANISNLLTYYLNVPVAVILLVKMLAFDR